MTTTPPTWEAGLRLNMTGIRAVVADTFASRCEILSRANLPDGQGGFVISDSDEDWRVIYSDVPCRIAEMTGRESFLKNQQTVEGDWVLTLGVSPPVSEDMRIELEGQEYEVMLTNAHQGYRTAQRLLLRQFS